MTLRKAISVFLIGVLTLTLTACNGSEEGPLVKRELLLDTVITLQVYDGGNEAILDEAIDRLKEIENRMSTTIDTSDVNVINENAGIEAVKVHEDVYYVIEKAKGFAEISGGAYEPTIGPLVNLWDINTYDERERDFIPSNEEIEKAKSLVNYKDLELREGNLVYLKEKGMKLDLGGIAKGYAADEVKRIFEENGITSAIIDLGGNIYAMGSKAGNQPWKIGIQNPFKSIGEHMGIYEVINKSVVTSGDYERYISYEGELYHHIIDSKTGYPSDNEVTGISIISDLSIDGDALSTALFVLGVDEGLDLIEKLDDVEVIFITKGKKVVIQEKTKEKFSLTKDDLDLIAK